VPVVAHTHLPTRLRRAVVFRRRECQHPTGPPRGEYSPRGRPPGGESQSDRGPGARAGTKPAAHGHPHPWCLNSRGDRQPTIRIRGGTAHPPQHKAPRHQGGLHAPPPSARDPARLSQTWRCGAPPAALCTNWRTINEVPPKEGWRTATAPKRVELPSIPCCYTQCDSTPSQPHPFGGKASQAVSPVVLSGNTRPERKPRRAPTPGVDRGRTTRATNTSYVTGIPLARVEGLEAALTPLPFIPSTPRPSPSNPQKTPTQTPSEDPQKTLPSGPMGPVSAEDGRSFGHRLELRRGMGAT